MMMMMMMKHDDDCNHVAPPLNKLDFPLRGGLSPRVKWTFPSVKGDLPLVSRLSPQKGQLSPRREWTFPL